MPGMLGSRRFGAIEEEEEEEERFIFPTTTTLVHTLNKFITLKFYTWLEKKR